MTDFMQAWNVSEKDFPRNGSAAEKLAFCLRYAVLAPSVYNTQPWYFEINGDTVSVYADRRYALAVIDPDDRQLSICCASALYTLRLVIRYFGYNETTELLPDPEEESLLARIRLGGLCETPVDETTGRLFKAIPKRHTNRGAFLDKPVPEDVVRHLQAAASSEGAWLHVCDPGERKVVFRMVAEADHIQAGNKHFRRELAGWIDQRRVLSGDGMPNYGLTYSDVVNKLSPSLVRRFMADNNKIATDEDLEANAPVLAVLGSKAGGALERIHTGQAFMHVLLQAECEGLSVSGLNQPCEVPELRLVLHDEIAHQGRSQMILRIGYGGKPSYTPRRDLADVMSVSNKKAPPKKPAPANDTHKSLFGRMKGLFGK